MDPARVAQDRKCSVFLAVWRRGAGHVTVKDVDEAPAPLPPNNRTNQRLQHQAIYGIELLDRLMRRAYTKGVRIHCHTKE